MVTAAWDTSNLVALYKNGVQCETCCGPPYLTEPDLCCPGWGEDSTPSQYTVKIEDVIDCPFAGAVAVNGTWVLDITGCAAPVEEPICGWLYTEAEEVGNVRVLITRQHTIGCAEIAISAWFWGEPGGIGQWLLAFGHGVEAYTKTTGYCDTLANGQIICDGLRWGRFGQATFWPGGWPAWVITTEYNLNDNAENNDVLYTCIASHTAAAANEPGVGVDWEDFWAQQDICGDANVACP